MPCTHRRMSLTVIGSLSCPPPIDLPTHWSKSDVSIVTASWSVVVMCVVDPGSMRAATERSEGARPASERPRRRYPAPQRASEKCWSCGHGRGCGDRQAIELDCVEAEESRLGFFRERCD